MGHPLLARAAVVGPGSRAPVAQATWAAATASLVHSRPDPPPTWDSLRAPRQARKPCVRTAERPTLLAQPYVSAPDSCRAVPSR